MNARELMIENILIWLPEKKRERARLDLEPIPDDLLPFVADIVSTESVKFALELGMFANSPTLAHIGHPVSEATGMADQPTDGKERA